MRRTLQRFRRVALVAVMVLSVGPAIGDAAEDEVASDSTSHRAVTGSATGGVGRSSEQAATEILRLRQLLGPAWRSDAIADSPKSLPDENEVIRTALVTQASAAPPETELEPRPAPTTQKTALRDAAYQLDLTAHALECHEVYDRADQLRALAQELRLQARGERQPVLLQRYGRFFRSIEQNPAD